MVRLPSCHDVQRQNKVPKDLEPGEDSRIVRIHETAKCSIICPNPRDIAVCYRFEKSQPISLS
jgi:hypothetical protein